MSSVCTTARNTMPLYSGLCTLRRFPSTIFATTRFGFYLKHRFSSILMCDIIFGLAVFNTNRIEFIVDGLSFLYLRNFDGENLFSVNS